MVNPVPLLTQTFEMRGGVKIKDPVSLLHKKCLSHVFSNIYVTHYSIYGTHPYITSAQFWTVDDPPTLSQHK